MAKDQNVWGACPCPAGKSLSQIHARNGSTVFDLGWHIKLELLGALADNELNIVTVQI